MCLIAMAWGVSAQYPLVIAANRDEFYARPTAPLAQWTAHAAGSSTSQGHTIISGRDLQDGGTWMGFSPGGRFAMLTNVRDPTAVPPKQPRSRGHLVVDWLSSGNTAQDWAAQFNFATYAGFNLIVGDWSSQQIHYLSNQATQAPKTSGAGTKLQALELGRIVGLSNAVLNTPWPKNNQLIAALGDSLNATEPGNSPCHLGTNAGSESTENNATALTDQIAATLQQALRDSQPAPQSLLPHTGVTLELEKILSSVMVRSPTYGTRTSTTAVLDKQGMLHLLEATHAIPPLPAGAIDCRLVIRWPELAGSIA